MTINVPHAYEISRELIRKNIIVDFREGAGIRIAPHFYTSDEELLYAIKQINTILANKTYRKTFKGLVNCYMISCTSCGVELYFDRMFRYALLL